MNTAPHLKLHPRERQICELVAQGLAHKETAARLGITCGTVKQVLSTKIFPKLGLSSQAELIRYWIMNVEMPTRGDCSTCCLRQNAMGGPDIATIE